MNLDNISDGALLDMLAKERAKYTRADEALMNTMIDELIRRKVYPSETVPKNPNTVHQMVNGWGAYWHQWGAWGKKSSRMICSLCQADIRNHDMGPPFLLEHTCSGKVT